MKAFAYLSLLVLMPLCALAQNQNSAPVAEPVMDTIPAAQDVAWPGVIRLVVDATDVTRGIIHVTETIPVAKAGPLALLYPQWLPGQHAPSGPIKEFAGLKLTADGKALAWRRDAVDVYAFHVDVPEKTSSIHAEFQYLAPTDTTQSRIVVTPDLLDLEWSSVTLYPAGHYSRRINVEASAKFPKGWKSASALEVASHDGATVHYKTAPLDVLIDSPVYAGAHFRSETLAPGVRLNMVADLPEELAATDEQIQFHRNLVTEAVKLFGAQHYDHYEFLLALSARQGGVGLEHHRSSENGVAGNYFTGWKDSIARRSLLPHEYTHSWNGKFRRPADLWTPDYRAPMRGSLLWVYEGQTQFWGLVLAARSGLISAGDVRDAIANIAARLDNDAGRQWRPVADTTDDPPLAERRPKGWRSWQRSEDYYNEGLLIWLDADSLIRERSHGARSLDDFARAFFGVKDRDWGELTYTFDDVVHALNDVEPYDWAAFLHQRVEAVNPRAPLDGLTRGGYRLAFTNEPSEYFKSNEKARKINDFALSGGFILDKEGAITEVEWDSAAFNAGLTVGSKLIAVNGRSLNTDDLKTMIKAKKSPLTLLLKTGDVYHSTELNYNDGLRYPTLEKTGSGPSGLDALLAPRK